MEQPEAVVLRSFQEDQPSAVAEDVLEVPGVEAEVVVVAELTVGEEEIASVPEDAMVP